MRIEALMVLGSASTSGLPTFRPEARHDITLRARYGTVQISRARPDHLKAWIARLWRGGVDLPVALGCFKAA